MNSIDWKGKEHAYFERFYRISNLWKGPYRSKLFTLQKYITDNMVQFIINNADEHAVFCVQRERIIRKLRAFNKQCKIYSLTET